MMMVIMLNIITTFNKEEQGEREEHQFQDQDHEQELHHGIWQAGRRAYVIPSIRRRQRSSTSAVIFRVSSLSSIALGTAIASTALRSRCKTSSTVASASPARQACRRCQRLEVGAAELIVLAI
jgi:hypothetical protein